MSIHLMKDTSPSPSTVLNDTSPIASPIFEDPSSTPAPSPLSNVPKSNDLPQTAIIVLLSTIPTIFCLAFIAAIVHCVHRWNERNMQAQQQVTVEKNLRLPSKPATARQLNQNQTKVLTPHGAQFVIDGDVPPLPQASETA